MGEGRGRRSETGRKKEGRKEGKKGFGNLFLESLLRSPYLNLAFPLTFVFLEISLNAFVVALPFVYKFAST